MYSEKVMDHFQHPRNVGEIENASGVGTVGNAKCGDIMRIYFGPSNFLLMHAMGPNVAGVIGSAVAAGILINIFG